MLCQLFTKQILKALRDLGYAELEKKAPLVVVAQDVRHGDFQWNGAMVLAKQVGKSPRELAGLIVSQLEKSSLQEMVELSLAGPGFINLKMTSEAWAAQMSRLMQDEERLGVPLVREPECIVVDFSAPNVAKPMHVGHIRSTIIGDCLARIAQFLGHRVIRDNHLGDWGTQFGMVIYAWKKELNQEALQKQPLEELLRLYRSAHQACIDEDVKEQCRAELVKLQNGDKENRAIWEQCVALSKEGLEAIYSRLQVSFDHWLGESYYHERLAGVVEELKQLGLAQESEGALCVFSDRSGDPKEDPFLIYRDEEWQDHPFLVRKRDGGYNYATTDIATIDYRVQEWKAQRIWYVVDARQSLHFKQLFSLAQRKGALGKDRALDLQHITFGTILGTDRKPLKTRDGDLPQLTDVLEDAVRQSEAVIRDKQTDLSASEQKALAEVIGIGAVKFTELSHHRNSDYIFDLDQMVALEGDTAPYLQYSYVRIQSIFRKVEQMPDLQNTSFLIQEPGEIALARALQKFGEIIPSLLDDFRPNLLALYLIELARCFHSFFESCPILKSAEEIRNSRLALCDLTAKTLKKGLGLLGIDVPKKM